MFAFEFEERLFAFAYPQPAFAPLFAFADKRAPDFRNRLLLNIFKESLKRREWRGKINSPRPPCLAVR